MTVKINEYLIKWKVKYFQLVNFKRKSYIETLTWLEEYCLRCVNNVFLNKATVWEYDIDTKINLSLCPFRIKANNSEPPPIRRTAKIQIIKRIVCFLIVSLGIMTSTSIYSVIIFLPCIRCQFCYTSLFINISLFPKSGKRGCFPCYVVT